MTFIIKLLKIPSWLFLVCCYYQIVAVKKQTVFKSQLWKENNMRLYITSNVEICPRYNPNETKQMEYVEGKIIDALIRGRVLRKGIEVWFKIQCWTLATQNMITSCCWKTNAGKVKEQWRPGRGPSSGNENIMGFKWMRIKNWDIG